MILVVSKLLAQVRHSANRQLGDILAIVLILVAGAAVALPGYAEQKSYGGSISMRSSFSQLSEEKHEGPAPNFGLDDRWNQSFTWFHYNGLTSCRGDIPKWNPNELGGFPYLPIGSTGALSPFQFLACPFPDEHQFFIASLVEFYIAALGVFCFLRFGLRADSACSALGATVFSLSGVAVAYSLFPHGFTGSWIGLLALLVTMIRREATVPRLITLGSIYAVLVALCALTGQPEMFVIVIASSALAGFLVRPSSRVLLPTKVSVVVVAVSAALGSALAAIQLIPTAHYSLGSVIAKIRTAETSLASEFAPDQLLLFAKDYVTRLLLGVMDPAFHGPPGPLPTLTTESLPYSRVTTYVGSGVLALAILSVGATKGKRLTTLHLPRSDGSAFMLAALIVSLAMWNFPFTNFLLDIVPIASHLDQSLLRWSFVFFIALGAAIGFQRVQRENRLSHFLFLFIALNLVMAITAFGLGRIVSIGKSVMTSEASALDKSQWTAFLNRTFLTHFAVASAGLLLTLLPRRVGQVRSMALVALVALEMVGVQAGIVNQWAEVFPTVEAVRGELAVVEQSGARLVGIGTPSPTIGTLLDVPTLNGYELMSPTHDVLAQSVRSCKGFAKGFVLEFCEYPVRPLEIQQFGNVGWILGPKGLDAPELTELQSIGDYGLYRSSLPLGNSFFVQGSECEAFTTLDVRELDASLKVNTVVEYRREAAGTMSFRFPPSSERRCLFVSESYDRGWSATNSSGNVRQVRPFAAIWQSIEVLPDDNGLQLTYQPRGYSAGVATTFSSGVLLLAVNSLVLVRTRARRKKD